jgi:hypothetical protein
MVILMVYGGNKMVEDSHVILYKSYKYTKFKLKEISSKYPRYIKHLLDVYLKHPHRPNYQDMTCNIYRKQIKHQQALKNLGFSILKLNDIEDMDDVIEYNMLIHKAQKLIKAITSQKYKKLVTAETITMFKSFVELEMSESELQDLIGSKLARFNSASDFNVFLKDTIKGLMSSSIIDIKKKLKNTKAYIVQDSNGILVVQVFSYEDSKKLGSKSWCISYDKNYWNQYMKNNSILSKIGIGEHRQYFIWNFNKDTLSKEYQIGVTMKKQDVVAANFRDNYEVSTSYVKQNYPMLFKLSEKIDKKVLVDRTHALNLSDMRKEDILDYIKRLKN